MLNELNDFGVYDIYDIDSVVDKLENKT